MSLQANIDLVLNNAALGAKIAVALAAGRSARFGTSGAARLE